MSFRPSRAANEIMYYARANGVHPLELLDKVSEINLDSALKAGKNNPALNIEVPENLKEMGKMLAQADIPQPPARQVADKTANTITV